MTSPRQRPGPSSTHRSTATPMDLRYHITVTGGEKPTQLKVTHQQRSVDNFFAKSFGVNTATITRSAVADFNGPAPMGSPCNTFGNEPAQRLRRPGSVAHHADLRLVPDARRVLGCDGRPRRRQEPGCRSSRPATAAAARTAAAAAPTPSSTPRGFIYMVRVGASGVGGARQAPDLRPRLCRDRSRCTSVTVARATTTRNDYPPADARTRYSQHAHRALHGRLRQRRAGQR